MSAFWAEGVRRKIPGLIDGDLLEAEVFSEGIRFYRQGEGSRLVHVLTWREIVRQANSRQEFTVKLPPVDAPLRIVPADERE